MFDVQLVGPKDPKDLNVVESIHCTYCDAVRPIKPLVRGVGPCWIFIMQHFFPSSPLIVIDAGHQQKWREDWRVGIVWSERSNYKAARSFLVMQANYLLIPED